MNEKLKIEFEAAASPVVRLLGHSLASVLGFGGLAVIALIPIGIMHLLIALGFVALADSLHFLERMLLVVDIGLFSVVFLSGVAVFVAETLATAWRHIRKAWNNVKHDSE